MEMAVMDERVSDMVARLEAGETLKEVGNYYSLTRERVRQLTTGLVNREKQKAARIATSFAMIDQYKDEIIEDWLNGKNANEIAQEMGLIFAHVRTRLKEWQSEMDKLTIRRRNLFHGQGSVRTFSDAECISIIQFIAEQENRTPSLTDYANWREQFPAWPSTATVVNRGWNELVKRAGFMPYTQPKGMGLRTFSDEDIFSSLRHVQSVVGHLPSIGEYDRHRLDGTPKSVTIRVRFQNWIKALEAFDQYEKQ